METLLIELYLLICRLYDTQPVLKQQRLSNNHEPLFTDEELLTIYLFGHMQGFTTQRRIYDYIRRHWRGWFPALPAYQSCNYRLNRLAPACELLVEELLTNAAWQVTASDDRLIDSMPVMLARGRRANRARVARCRGHRLLRHQAAALPRRQAALHRGAAHEAVTLAGEDSSVAGFAA